MTLTKSRRNHTLGKFVARKTLRTGRRCVFLVLCFLLLGRNTKLFERGEEALSLCSIGSEPFSRAWLLSQLEEFREVFDRQPLKPSSSGSQRLFHAFAQWCVVRHVRPRLIVENGVKLGWNTHLLRQAAGPETHIVIISPYLPSEVAKHLGQSYYEDSGKSTYLSGADFVDFRSVNWDNVAGSAIDFETALVYFNDHQSGYRRLIEAQQAGFKHLVFDDGRPWPGDSYTLKQACDFDGRLANLRSGRRNQGHRAVEYYDDFSNFVSEINATEKYCVFRDVTQRIRTYYEFPPLWEGAFHQHTSLRELSKMAQRPLLDSAGAIEFLSKFKRRKLGMKREASRYNFFTYAVAKSEPQVPADCFAGASFPLRYRVP